MYGSCIPLHEDDLFFGNGVLCDDDFRVDDLCDDDLRIDTLCDDDFRVDSFRFDNDVFDFDFDFDFGFDDDIMTGSSVDGSPK